MNDFEYANIDDFIDALRKKFGVKLSDTYDFAEKHIKDIKKISNIFNLKSDIDKERCMVLARILAPEYADTIIHFSRKEKFNATGLNYIEEPTINKYSTELISAFIYNPQFLKMAWNWCVITYHEARAQWVVGSLDAFAQAATSGEKTDTVIREKNNFILNGALCDILIIQRKDGKIEYELHIKEPEKFGSPYKLKLLLNKGETLLGSEVLFLQSIKSENELLYSTGTIPYIELDAELVIEPVVENTTENNA